MEVSCLTGQSPQWAVVEEEEEEEEEEEPRKLQKVNSMVQATRKYGRGIYKSKMHAAPKRRCQHPEGYSPISRRRENLKTYKLSCVSLLQHR
jgi:hypothetical protein